MIFESPTLLIAIFLVALPFIILLFFTHKGKTIWWAATTFLKNEMLMLQKRSKAEKFLTLFLRASFVLMLVLAFARPLCVRQQMAFVVMILFSLFIAIAMLTMAFSLIGRAKKIIFLFLGLLLASIAIIFLISTHFKMRVLQDIRKKLTIIVDTSSSMFFTNGLEMPIEKAFKDLKIIQANLSKREPLLLLAGGVVSEASPLKELHTKVSQLSLTSSNFLNRAPIHLSIIQALRKIREKSVKNNIILIFSDMQYATWQEVLDEGFVEKLTKEYGDVLGNTSFLILPYYHTFPTNNLALINFSIYPPLAMQADEFFLRCDITNTGNGVASLEKLEIKLDARTLYLTNLSGVLSPQMSTTLVWSASRLPAGEHIFSAFLNKTDDIAGDNISHFVVRVMPKLKVLILDGKAFKNVSNSSGEIINRVLSSAAIIGKKQHVVSYDIRKINYTDLNFTNYSQPDIIVLANIAFLPQNTAETIAKFVEDGGILLVAAGNNIEPDFYNFWKSTDGRFILPAIFKEMIFFPASEWQLNFRDLKVLKKPNIENEKEFWLEGVKLSNLWRLERRIYDCLFDISFKNGIPLFISNKIKDGAVILSAMSFEENEGDLQEKTFFAPLLHEVLRNTFINMGYSANFYVGEPIRTIIPSAKSYQLNPHPINTYADIKLLNGKKEGSCYVEMKNGKLICANPALHQPGLYEILMPKNFGYEYGKKIHINVIDAFTESDPTIVPFKELLHLMDKIDFKIVKSVEDVIKAQQNKDNLLALWHFFILMAILFFFCDFFITRFSFHNDHPK